MCMIHSTFKYTERVCGSVKGMKIDMAMGLIIVRNESGCLLFGNESGCRPVGE